MTNNYLNDLFQLYLKKDKKLISKLYYYKNDLLKLTKYDDENDDNKSIHIESDLKGFKIVNLKKKDETTEKTEKTETIYTNNNLYQDINELYKFKLINNDIKNITNNQLNFIKLIDNVKIFFSSSSLKKFLNYYEVNFNEINKNIQKIIKEFNNNIIKKIQKEIEENGEKKNKISKYAENKLIKDKDKQFILNYFNKNLDKFENNLTDLINIFKEYITNKLNDLDKEKGEINNEIEKFKEKDDIIKYLDIYYNKFSKNFKEKLDKNIENEYYINTLFKKNNKNTNDIFTPELKDIKEDLDDKYRDFKEKIYDKYKDEKDLNNIPKSLVNNYHSLFETNYGDWIKDSKEDKEIKKYKELYDKIVINTQIDKVIIKKEYKELNNFTEKIKEIKNKLEKKEKLDETEERFISNFDLYINQIAINPEYKSNEDFKKQIELTKELYNNIKIEEKTLKEKVEEEKKDKRIIKKVLKESEKKIDSVYFEDYIQIFKIGLKILTYGGIFFSFIILFISFISIIILIYDIIINIIKLFVNSNNSTKNNSLDYLTKSIIRCNKDNYKEDRFLILTEQKQNLTIFNIGAYTIYLLLIYLITFLILTFYSNQMNYKFIGSLYDIDINLIYISMIGLLLIYSSIHLFLFKIIFKKYVYIPYWNIDKEEDEIDKMISNFILIKTDKDDILRDDNFFILLYDASKIDELSDYFLKEIRNENKSNCLEQKIIIYNLYNYLRQYIDFNENFQKNFKLYCSTENKPKYDNGNKITFLSMLNNNEVKIIMNYHEELAFINKLGDDNIEFYNKINKNISNKIRDINKKIITHNKTILPFFLTIFYIIIIFLLNFFIIYFIIQMIITDKTDAYHIYIQNFSNIINNFIYKPFLNLFKK